MLDPSTESIGDTNGTLSTLPGEEVDGLVRGRWRYASGVMPATTQLRFAVVGYGYWGPHLARSLAHLPSGRLTHIVDTSADRRQMAQREYPSARVTGRIEEVFDSDVDAVVVATPIRTHYPLARTALERGKHVLV